MSAARLVYSGRVLELFRSLPGAGNLAVGEGRVVSAEAIALDRGAWVRFEARIDGGRVVDCVFRAFGCPHTLAAAALVAERVRARPVADALSVDAASLARELDAPAEKMGRLLVVEDALRALFRGAPQLQ